jgi:hypothetical protein
MTVMVERNVAANPVGEHSPTYLYEFLRHCLKSLYNISWSQNLEQALSLFALRPKLLS